MFSIKNTKEMLELLSKYTYIYIGYDIDNDEFTYTDHKPEKSIYLFKVSKHDLIKIV